MDLQLNEGDRIGLIGRNGAGKTTLLKILMGQLRPDVGDVVLRTDKICYLSQSLELVKEKTVADAIKTPGSKSQLLRGRLRELERMMASNDRSLDWNSLAEEYARVERELGSLKDEEIESRAKDALDQVGLTQARLEGKVSELSGGEVTKVMLARILMEAGASDLIFLDEPTSHLDIETVEWLEDYLTKLKAAMVIVSHDRYFLDRVVMQVAELEDGRLRRYQGNYSIFIQKKALDVEREKIAFEKNRVERERNLRIAEEQHNRLWYAATHKVRLKMVDRMELRDAPKEEKEIRVAFDAVGKSGKNVILASDLRVERGGRKVIKGLDLDVQIGDKLGIFGPNGSGKTTLLKAILLDLPYHGNLWVAPGAQIGYYAQGQDFLNSTLTPEELLVKIMGKEERLKARGLLAKFLLFEEHVERPIGTLSNGERARVALAILMAEERNLLILDEPTNYLDIPSRHAVEAALSDYPGTILMVTHDRYFMDSICNRVGELKEGRLTLFKGNYSQMKGQRPRPVMLEQANTYKVISSFKDWTTGRKYSAGEKVNIAPSEMEAFKWALDTGKLKRIAGSEKKLVKR